MTEDEALKRLEAALHHQAECRRELVALQKELLKGRKTNRWTAKNIEDAKTIKQLFPHDAELIRCNDKTDFSVMDGAGEVIVRIFDTMFSRMKVGEIVDLDEIIGGASNDQG